jgi:hypothetical protein
MIHNKIVGPFLSKFLEGKMLDEKCPLVYPCAKRTYGHT